MLLGGDQPKACRIIGGFQVHFYLVKQEKPIDLVTKDKWASRQSDSFEDYPRYFGDCLL